MLILEIKIILQTVVKGPRWEEIFIDKNMPSIDRQGNRDCEIGLSSSDDRGSVFTA